MKLSDLGGPFEEATAAATVAAAGATIDRIQGTTLASSAVVLDGTLPPQKPIVSRVWIGPLVLLGTLGVLVYFEGRRARNAETPEQADARIRRGQADTRREIQRVVKQTSRFQRRQQTA